MLLHGAAQRRAAAHACVRPWQLLASLVGKECSEILMKMRRCLTCVILHVTSHAGKSGLPIPLLEGVNAQHLNQFAYSFKPLKTHRYPGCRFHTRMGRPG